MSTSKKNQSWKDAFWATPGPSNLKEAAMLMFKGMCMGTADIIPGVSGGTIALITGIYQDLLLAIKSAGIKAFQRLFVFDVKGALAEMHLRFLICLFLGICTAIITLARIMNYLIHHQPVLTWSLFFGLIAASIWTVGKKVEEKNVATVISFLVGAFAAWGIVGIIPVSTPEELWFVFTSGLIAICAMILPGLSGAFILLILGKYEFITGTLKNPFIINNIIIIGVFCAGCGIGLMGFSRVLSYFLNRYHSATLAFLTGLMAGAMRKVWPWKEVLEEKIIRGKTHVIKDQNILPPSLDQDVVWAILLIITGFVLVIWLEWFSMRKSKPAPTLNAS